MIPTRMIHSLTILVLLAGLRLTSVQAKDEEGDRENKEQKQAQTEISLQKAAKIALRAFKIKSGELEKENGRLIWSFDIALTKSKDVVEVQVDAKTGKIVSMEIESAKEEAKEAKGEKRVTKPENKERAKKAERKSDKQGEE